jgi:hypothetical protein
MISVLSSSTGCIGFLRSAGTKGFTTHGSDGQPLDLFQDKQAAFTAATT